MGAAVGQVPEYTEMITSWVKEAAKIPVIVKLTPNVTISRSIAAAADRGGADAVSLINTINSLMGVDLETFAPRPECRRAIDRTAGIAVRGEADRSAFAVIGCEKRRIPISGIGGMAYWNDAAEHIALAAPPPCRFAPPPCTTDFASSRT